MLLLSDRLTEGAAVGAVVGADVATLVVLMLSVCLVCRYTAITSAGVRVRFQMAMSS